MGALVANERFVVERAAGIGGMGAVYRAIDQHSGAAVALKVSLDDGDEYRSRALSEAGALAALDHPAVVKLIASGIGNDGRPFLAMEWLDGEDLGARITRNSLTLSEAVQLGVRLAEGLAAAHSIGIVHRDLKPSNVFLPAGSIGRAKLVDFGIARIANRRVTATGIVLGTPGYMAPEQAMGRGDVGAPADIFALGAVLYECILGEAAFVGAHAVAVLAKVLFEEVTPLEARDGSIPTTLSALVARMLNKEPAARPTAFAVAKELADLLPMLGATMCGDLRVGRRDYAESSGHAALALSDEQQLVCVLVARFASNHSIPPPSHDTPREVALAGDTDALERLRVVVAPLGGRAERLVDGTLVASWTGTGAPRDMAARAAKAALFARERLPGCALALGSGLTSSTDQLRFGSALDRAAESVGRLGMSGVCIDDVTAGLLDERFVVEPAACGHLLLGRKSLEDGPTRRLAGRTSPCVGRERELRMLGDLLDECIDAPRVAVAMVTAVPGIGKSRLCREFLRTVRLREDVQLWSAEADELGMGSPYAFVGAVLQCAVGMKPADSLEERRQKLMERVKRHVSEKDRARIAAMLGEIVAAPFPASSYSLLAAARNDPAVMAEQVRRAFIDWLDAETKDNAILLVFEDLHWGDAPSIKLVTAAVTALRDRPFMVLGFARPEAAERFADLWALRERQEIRLGGLSKRAATKLVENALPQVDSALVARLVERAAGNTLYLEELVRAVAAGRGENLPETIAAMVQARFAELPPEQRRIVRAASVFGGAFWLGAIASILGSNSAKPTGLDATDIDALIEKEILERRAESALTNEQEFVFRHALLREGAHALLTDADRAACHRRAAEWLEKQSIVNDHTIRNTINNSAHSADRVDGRLGKELSPARIAYHYELGGAVDLATSWYARAASHALLVGDPVGSLASAERGMQLFDSLDDKESRSALELDLRISQLRGIYLTRGFAAAEAIPVLERADALCPPGNPARHVILHAYWMRSLASGDVWKGRAFASQMLHLAQSEQKPSAVVVAHLALGMNCVFLGEQDQARQNLEAALAQFDRNAHPEASLVMGADIEVYVLCYLSMAQWALGLLDQGIATAKKALDLAEELAHPFSRAVAASFASIHHQTRRDRAQTLEWATRTRQLAEQYGFLHYVNQSRIVSGWASSSDDQHAALEEIQSGIDARRARGALLAIPHFVTMFVDVQLSLGLVDDALRTLEDAVHIMNKTGERIFAADIHRLFGEAFLMRAGPDDLDRAEDAFLRACEIAHYQGARTLELRAATSLARLWQKMGNGAEGCQKVSALLALFTEGSGLLDIEQARALVQEECQK